MESGGDGSRSRDNRRESMIHEQQQMLNLREQAPIRALLSWWQELDRARGDRAALRRCHTLAEIVLTPASIAAAATSLTVKPSK